MKAIQPLWVSNLIVTNWAHPTWPFLKNWPSEAIEIRPNEANLCWNLKAPGKCAQLTAARNDPGDSRKAWTNRRCTPSQNSGRQMCTIAGKYQLCKIGPPSSDWSKLNTIQNRKFLDFRMKRAATWISPGFKFPWKLQNSRSSYRIRQWPL